MKKTNKLISILLVMAMLLTMAPVAMFTASAAGTPSYSATSEGVRLYANGTNLFIVAGTDSGTAVYYMNGSTKTYVNPNGAKGDDLSDSEIYMGTQSSNDDYFDVSLVMTGGEVGTIYTAKGYGYLVGKVTVAVTGTAKVGVIWCGSKFGPDNGTDLHTRKGNLAVFDTVGAEIFSGSTGVDGKIKKTATGWEVIGSAFIPAGITMSVDAGQTVTVPANASVQNNGTLINNGTLELYGAVTGNNITGNGTINCYSDYIENVSTVGSVSAKINGTPVTLANGQYRLSGGKLYIWLPDGDAEVILNNVKYYGTIVKGSPKKLNTAYTAISSITGIPSEIDAYITTKLSPMSNQATFVPGFSYDILTDGTTAPEARVTDSSIFAAGAGIIKLKVTASDGYTSYSKVFDITVKDNGYAASVTNGSVTISKYSDTQLKVTHSEYTGGYILINKEDNLIITGTSTSANNVIIVESGDVNIVLKDCSISFYSMSTPPLNIASGAKVKLIPIGTSSLTNTASTSNSKSITTAINVPKGAELIIDGPGTLNANGGECSAAIGTHYSQAPGTIIINGGTINATAGYYAAAIGSGGSYQSKENYAGGTITINGGTVNALSKDEGAGIGGGMKSDGGTITINGGTVTAESYYGAGIGGGGAYGSDNVAGNGGKITINGGTVIAKSTNGGAGIGSGRSKDKQGGSGGTVVINGGNVKAISKEAEAIGKGRNGVSSGTLKDASGNSLSLNTIKLNGAAADTTVTLVEGINYGLTDVKTLDTDKLYFYLPTDSAPLAITAGGNEYICNGNLTFYTAHSWANNDGVCANGCGLECAHAGQTGESCEICGATLHTHSFSYTANGNVITATCSNADGYCTDTNGGTLTISAPAELYTDGTISREAVIDNQLVEATDYTVSYSTADGSVPKTAGTYTASVTVGGATASVEFTLLNYAAKVTDEDGNLISNYKTLADAVTAAQENEYSTLTLLDDITVTTFQIINSGNFTIDLNGKTLLSESSFALRIQSGAHVTIKDSGEGGTVESKAAGAKAVINYGGLTVESGTMKGDGGIDNRGFLNFIGGTAEGVTYSAIDNCESASVYGGVMKSENGNGITNDSGGVLNVYGGEISGCSGIANYDTAFLSGGEFKGNSYAAINLISGTVEITGGSFTGTDDEYGSLSGTPYGESTVDYTEGANLILKGGEFPNGFTVHNTTANTLLADGYYFRNEQGKVVDGSSRIIEEKVTVEKGVDFSADAVVTVEDVVYNGTAQEPTVTVKVGDKTLIEGKDYTLTFANNINAGTATVTVKAVGQTAGGIVGGGNSNAGNSVESIYTGEITKEFTILKADSSIDVYPEANKLTYNGEVQALVTAGLSKNGAVVYSLDGAEYSETIPTGTNAGEYTIYYKVEGDSNHNDSEPEIVTVTIKAKDISDGFIILGEALTYNGTEQTQTVEKVLTTNNLEATYTVSGNKATNVGVYLLTVTGTGNFTGEAMLTFEIAPDTSKIDALTVDNVTSANKADVESVKAQIDNASTEYASYETKAEYNAIAEKCVELLAVIGDTADEIKRITDAVNTYDIDSVTGDDVFALAQLADDVEALLDTDNITEAEREALIQLGKNIQTLISRYDRISAQLADIKERMNKYDEATVKSSDKADIEQLIADIKELTDGQNLTADEREYLVNADAKCDNLLAKIAETKSEYDRVIAAANGYDEATVTSVDKDALVQLNEDIYALALTDNVTEEEKENLQAAHDKVFGLIDKLVGISDEIKRITEVVDKYVFESVKSSDKADIKQLIDDIKALLDTQNITADERTILETADETCDKLIAKIDETVAEIKRINNATNAYDEATVTSADKETVENFIADIKALTDGDNITEAEREQLNGNEATLKTILDKINATADEIARIETAVNGYDEATVKSTGKADLEQLKTDIKALTDATNITGDERAKLGELDAKLDSLIKKIDDTASEITRIDEAVNSYDIETVTSADIPALGKLIDDIKALTDGDNLTDDEKAALEANDEAINELVEKLTEVAEEIKRVDEAVKSYDENSVKSTDSENLEQLKEDIQALIDSTNTSENEKTALEEMIKDIEGLEDKIDETAKEIERIENAVNGYNEETVKSSDEEIINQLKEDIQTLIDSGNVTEEEISGLEETKADTDALTDKIDETLAEIDRISEAVNNYNEETVKSSDKEAIEQLKEDIQTLIDSGNVTGEEIAVLEDTKADAIDLTDKITEIEEKLEEIAGFENDFDSEKVTSDDKAVIEEKIAEIEAVNPDNLTPEQKAEYDEIKAGFEALLDKIEEASKAVTDIGVELEKFDEKRVTIFWKDEIEALKAKIDELLADENMGEAEKAKLNEYKAQAENLIEIINNPVSYFSFRFVYFIQDCLNFKMGGLTWLLNAVFSIVIG